MLWGGAFELVSGSVGSLAGALAVVGRERETIPWTAGRGSSPMRRGRSAACTLPTTRSGARALEVGDWAMVWKSARTCARAKVLAASWVEG